MTNDKIFEGDVGVDFIIHFFYYDVNNVKTDLDISSATLSLTFLKPIKTTFQRVLTLVGDGTDGLCHYTSVTDDLIGSGDWQLQGYVIIDEEPKHSEIGRFTVHANIVENP